MREIKFRGKRFDTKEWIYGDLLDNSVISSGGIDVDNEYISIDEWCSIIPSTIGQYTGLKDKNGVEIFEGDIIKLSYLSPLDNKEKVSLYRVEEMQNGYYAIKEVTDKQRGDSGLFLHFQRCEVIGDIYENPELLGGTTK